MSTKNSSDTIGNRTRDLPVCRAVSQPTATTRVPYIILTLTLISYTLQLFAVIKYCHHYKHCPGMVSICRFHRR